MSPHRTPQPLAPPIARAVAVLAWTERVVFFAIGLLMFVACAALLRSAALVLLNLWSGGTSSVMGYGSEFLDVVLLVLMIVELAYTVILSLRGAVLVAEPFLIVGLIAVIRRILVITVGEVNDAGTNPVASGPSSVVQHATELGILTGVVIALVASIFILRLRPNPDGAPLDDEELLEGR